jgi:hypothetical protein
MPSSAGLLFPHSRVLLPRTRLAYIHLRNLLTDAKRDRAARISGYVAIALPDELVTLYLLKGEVANASVRDPDGTRAVAIAEAIDMVPNEPEYGEICFNEADVEQLACMFEAHVTAPEAWPEGLAAQDPTALFPYLMSTTFDGMVEIIANQYVNYLIFKHGTVARTFLAAPHHGTVVDRVAKLFAREGRVGELHVSRWGPPPALPQQAPPALVQAYRELTAALVVSGLDVGRFTFFGFLTRSGSERRSTLDEIATMRHTAVLYESPNRVVATLAELERRGGGARHAVVAREMTKQFEEIQRGTLSELRAYYEKKPPRGEIVLVIGPASEQSPSDEFVRERVGALRASGLSARDVAAQVAHELGVPKRVAYRLAQHPQKTDAGELDE